MPYVIGQSLTLRQGGNKMRTKRMYSAVAGLLLLIAGAAEAADPARAERIDQLLKALQTDDGSKAPEITRKLWHEWSQSGSPSHDLLLIRGKRAMQAGAYEKALEHLTDLIRLAPDFAEGWNARATVWFLMDDYPNALADVAEVLQREPRHFGAIEGMALIFERLNQEEKAYAAWQAALKINPHLPAASEAVERLGKKLGPRNL